MPTPATLRGYSWPKCRAYAAYDLSQLKQVDGKKVLPGLPSPCELRAGSLLNLDQRLKINGLRLTGRYQPGDLILGLSNREQGTIQCDSEVYDCINGYIVIVSGFTGLTDGPVPPGDGLASCPIYVPPIPPVPTQEPVLIPNPTPDPFTFDISKLTEYIPDENVGNAYTSSTPADFTTPGLHSFGPETQNLEIVHTFTSEEPNYHAQAQTTITIQCASGSGTITLGTQFLGLVVSAIPGVDHLNAAGSLRITSSASGELYFGDYLADEDNPSAYLSPADPAPTYLITFGETITIVSYVSGLAISGSNAGLSCTSRLFNFEIA